MTDEELRDKLANEFATGPGLEVSSIDKANGVINFTSKTVYDSSLEPAFKAGWNAARANPISVYASKASIEAMGTVERYEYFDEVLVPQLLAERDQLRAKLQRAKAELEFIASGCLVPPDGGMPCREDAIEAARAALKELDLEPSTQKEQK